MNGGSISKLVYLSNVFRNWSYLTLCFGQFEDRRIMENTREMLIIEMDVWMYLDVFQLYIFILFISLKGIFGWMEYNVAKNVFPLTVEWAAANQALHNHASSGATRWHPNHQYILYYTISFNQSYTTNEMHNALWLAGNILGKLARLDRLSLQSVTQISKCSCLCSS